MPKPQPHNNHMRKDAAFGLAADARRQAAGIHIVNTQASRVALTQFVPGSDLLIVEEWLKHPHVARWWGDPKEAIAEIRKHPAATSALILADGTPIGYLCWQVPTHQELADAGLADLPANLVDIDIMIGEPSALGLGLGPEALSKLLGKLRDEGVQVVGMATADSNRRASRAFEKAGFSLYRVFIESGRKMRYFTKVLNAAA